MSFPVKETIRNRKVFDPLTQADGDKLEQFIQNVPNPWNVPVTFKLPGAKEYNLSNPVIVGTHLYTTAKTSRCKDFDLTMKKVLSDNLWIRLPV